MESNSDRGRRSLRAWAAEVCEALLEGLPDAMMLVDHDGAIQLVTGQASVLLGYEPGELLGQSVEVLVPSPVRARHASLRDSYFETPRVRTMAAGRDLVAVRRDGTEFPVDISLSMVQSPFGPVACVALRDVSDRVEVRLALERSRRALEEQVRERTQQLWNSNRLLTLDIEARLYAEEALGRQVRQAQMLANLGERALRDTVELVLESAPAAVCDVLNVDVVEIREHVVDDVSLHRRAFAGFQREPLEVLALEPRTSSPQSYAYLMMMPVTVSDVGADKRFPPQVDLIADGVTSAILVPIPAEEQPYGVMLVGTRGKREFSIEDVTFLQATASTLGAAVAQARYRTRMLEQESLARVGAMASVVAHEVRNPLGGISGAVQLLAKSLPEGGEEHEIIDMILKRIKVLNETIGDLLAFARPRTPLVAPTSVVALVRRAEELFAKDPTQAEMRVEIVGDDVEVEVDRDQMEAVFVNLFVNASQAMDAKGLVSVRISEASSFCRIEVADSGPGIPPELRQRIFEPFFTTKRQGTGLGLATARRVVETHGGTLTAASGPGGATMTLMLPRTACRETVQ